MRDDLIILAAMMIAIPIVIGFNFAVGIPMAFHGVGLMVAAELMVVAVPLGLGIEALINRLHRPRRVDSQARPMGPTVMAGSVFFQRPPSYISLILPFFISS